MKDGMITQSGKFNVILDSGTYFMELVHPHREVLSALNPLERSPSSKKYSISMNEKDLLTTFELD